MRKKRKSRRTGLCLIAFMVFFICGIISFKKHEMDEINAKSITRLSALNTEIEEEKERAEKIQEMKAYVQTKKYIEEMAREKLGLVYEDEIIFKSEE